MGVEHVVHYSEVDFFLYVCSFLAVENNFVEAVNLWNERLRVFICEVLVVLPQDSFDEFEFRSTDSLQDKFAIARIVEKAATFATGT